MQIVNAIKKFKCYDFILYNILNEHYNVFSL